jgi:hypothetical protein
MANTANTTHTQGNREINTLTPTVVKTLATTGVETRPELREH